MKKWNKTISDTAKFDVVESNYSQFSTADTFLSNELSPEGAELMENAYGFKGDYMQKINPFSYRTYLEKKLHVLQNHGDNGRPLKGMNDSITILKQKVEHQGGIIYLKETVTAIDKRVDGFVIQTKNFAVKANKTVITPGPGALKMIKGDVIQNITDNEIFKAIVSVPAFQGAAVYKDAWWNDTIAHVAQMNDSQQPLEMFISTSNCLGVTMPYKGVGHNGTAVLHTIANNGGCSDKWGEILAISPDEVDKELKRALKYKFQRDDIPDPLETKYKYWKEGFWYLQKPGADFNLTAIRQWAKRPLTGQDVFLVNRAFYNFGGYLDDDILSTKEALDEGWKLPLPF
ncbi:hypothetical protein OS493_019030 [Desmophyllum pertusum]|uniref:Uncharacterized protein n=1 Tax=Desmophyllum pertusum TaxID=174260 RepID=A0A9X0CR91_9CNID|nr:hypothetical protein OS493_019030 [Desmophyllum pertusum]